MNDKTETIVVKKVGEKFEEIKEPKSLEDSMRDVLGNKLHDGTLEKIIAQNFEKGLNNACSSLFASYGDITKLIEAQLKGVMVPFIETYDFNKYLIKLDEVLVSVLKSGAGVNKKLLTNFKSLMTEPEEREISIDDLFGKWTKYVSENIETSGREIDYDDNPTYIEEKCTYIVEIDEKYDWSNYEYGKIIFECEAKDEIDGSMNFEVRISKSVDDKVWDIHYNSNVNLTSLRRLNEFQILLMRLNQSDVKLVIDDKTEDEEHVTPEKEPEADYS